MKEALEGGVLQVNFQVFHDVCYDLQTSILNCLLECLLHMPEHDVVHVLRVLEDLLEGFKVVFLCTLKHCSTTGHELEEYGFVLGFKSLNFSPNTTYD